MITALDKGSNANKHSGHTGSCSYSVFGTLQLTELINKFVIVGIRKTRVDITGYFIGKHSPGLLCVVEYEAGGGKNGSAMFAMLTTCGLRTNGGSLEVLFLFQKITQLGCSAKRKIVRNAVVRNG